MLKRLIGATMTMLLLIVFLLPGSAFAADNWSKVVSDVQKTFAQALKTYEQGDVEKAKNLVNDAYYDSYEAGQMEKAVKFNISGKRNAIIEEEFRQIRKLMSSKASKAEVSKKMTELVNMLKEDAATLSKSTGGAVGMFLSSFLILVREGFEAILVIGAIIAYLIKSGNANKVKIIYQSAIVALIASALTAIGIKYLFDISGASQENLEGITMLIAVVVLFSVSYWLISKSEAAKWKGYIEGKVKNSLNTGNAMTLWLAAFLAVYREGAETVLFYQALLAGEKSGTETAMIGVGFVAGSIALVIIYLVIRYGSVKLPLKPFFIGTSILLYYMAFMFAGDGVNELQAGNLVAATPIPGAPIISFLGIYPTVETMTAQAILLVITLAGFAYKWFTRSKKEGFNIS